MKLFRAATTAAVLAVLGAGPLFTAANAEDAGFKPGEPRKGWSFRDAGLIPIQSGGRLKPLDSYAREIVLYVTGSRSHAGWQPVDLLFSWLSFYRGWESLPLIQVQHPLV